MLSFVTTWFGASANPIGIDFGSDSLRLAQVQTAGDDHQLLAAASCDVPEYAKADLESRLDFFSQAARELLQQGRFRGRRVMLSLPAAMMHVRQFRMPKVGKAEFHQLLQREAQTRLPINPAAAILRHLTAGEVTINGQLMQEVILIAAARDGINKYLAAAAKLKLNVVGMNVEPLAIVDCFSHVHRRKSDDGVTSCYVDLGATGSRAVIANGPHVLLARQIPFGSSQLNAAVASATELSETDAALLRLKLTASEHRDQRNVSPQQTNADHEHAGDVADAVANIGRQISAELTRCVRDCQSTFPGHRVQRLIFVGGEARQRSLCEQIAREMHLPAQIGDPLVRMGRSAEIPIESGIDRRLPQPAWAVAIGLSFAHPRIADGGPVLSTVATVAATKQATPEDPDDDGVLLNATDRFTDADLEPSEVAR